MEQRRTAVFIMAFIALAGGLMTGNELLFNIAYLLAFLLLFSFGWAWTSIHWVQLSRSTRTRRTQVGLPLEERFLVQNTSIVPKLWIEVRDFGNLPGHLSSQVINTLGPRNSYVWRVATICHKRGRYQLGPLRLRTSDPFGLFPMERDFPASANVVIFPKTYDIHQFALPIGILPGGDALRRRTHYVTTNASGVREYAPGDSFSRIHWKSTARRNRLIVKEFELDPLADIWIVPDMASFVHTTQAENDTANDVEKSRIPIWMRVDEEFTLPETTEEYTISVAASLTQYFLRRDRAVGMLAYGQSNEIVQPDRGERQLNRILETLSVIRAQGQTPVQDALHAESHLLPRGTTAIVVTPTTDEEWMTSARQLSRRGLRIVTVSIEPQSFGGQRSSAALTDLLLASGLGAYSVQCGDSITAVLSQGQAKAGYFTI